MCHVIEWRSWSAMSAAAAGVVRAAVDIGSGAVKLGVAEVAGGRIVRMLADEQHVLLLARDMALNGGRAISPAGADALVHTVRRLVDRARALGAEHRVAGIATAVFRAADNGAALLDRLAAEAGVRAEIISQGGALRAVAGIRLN